jgi:hypothetical protein
MWDTNIARTGPTMTAATPQKVNSAHSSYTMSTDMTVIVV